MLCQVPSCQSHVRLCWGPAASYLQKYKCQARKLSSCFLLLWSLVVSTTTHRFFVEWQKQVLFALFAELAKLDPLEGEDSCPGLFRFLGSSRCFQESPGRLSASLQWKGWRGGAVSTLERHQMMRIHTSDRSLHRQERGPPHNWRTSTVLWGWLFMTGSVDPIVFSRLCMKSLGWLSLSPCSGSHGEGLSCRVAIRHKKEEDDIKNMRKCGNIGEKCGNIGALI